MSKDLKDLVDRYNDLLIATLELANPGALLAKVLAGIEDTQICIEKGLLR